MVSSPGEFRHDRQQWIDVAGCRRRDEEQVLAQDDPSSTGQHKRPGHDDPPPALSVITKVHDCLLSGRT
jgi:hypothetical protein